jgi:hypothetical protein
MDDCDLGATLIEVGDNLALRAEGLIGGVTSRMGRLHGHLIKFARLRTLPEPLLVKDLAQRGRSYTL